MACLLAASPALSETCRPPSDQPRPAAGRAGCKPQDRLQPYDPDAVRSGRQPGFIDLGNGTELRVGGRAQMDYDMRR